MTILRVQYIGEPQSRGEEGSYTSPEVPYNGATPEAVDKISHLTTSTETIRRGQYAHSMHPSRGQVGLVKIFYFNYPVSGGYNRSLKSVTEFGPVILRHRDI